MLALLLLAAAVRHHHRGHAVSSPAPTHARTYTPPVELDARSTIVEVDDIEAYTVVTPGAGSWRAQEPPSYESVVRVFAMASNTMYNEGDLDFNLTVTYSVDGLRVGVAEHGYKLHESNLGNGEPQRGAGRSRRVAALGWDFRSLTKVETVCLTIRVVAWWVANDQIAGESEPIDRCVALNARSLHDVPSGGSRRRRGRPAKVADAPTTIAPFPTALTQAVTIEPRGTRLQLTKIVAVAPAPHPPAPELEIAARFRLHRYDEWIVPWTEVKAVALGPLGDGSYADSAPGVPAHARAWRLSAVVWNETSDAAALTDVWAHWEVTARKPGAAEGEAVTSTFTSAVCSRNSWFACTWTTPYRASAQNDWGAQGGRMFPTYVPCEHTPTPSLLAQLAHKHHAYSAFAPLDDLRSLLRIEYDSPGGVFTECMQSVWNERMERRVHAEQHSFRVDPFLGVQQIAPWSVRSAHLNSYSCNASETMGAQGYSGASAFGGEDWLCLGADNYQPAVGWTAKPDALYTLVAWSAPQPRMDDTTLQWLVVDIPGSDVAKGTTIQRYIGPLSTGYFFNYTVVSFAVFEQPKGVRLAQLHRVWSTLGLHDDAAAARAAGARSEGPDAMGAGWHDAGLRLGAAPISVDELIAWLGLPKPYAFNYFFTFTDFWTPFAMQYVYGDPKSAADVCKTDMVNHIINPRGGYCTNGFGASPINAAWPYQYLRFDDNGLNPMVLGICAANGFFYPELQADGWQVNLTALKSSLLVPSGKVIKDFGKVVTDCQPEDATVIWMGERFCAGADFALPKYYQKVSLCDWDSLVPLADSTLPDIIHPPKRAQLEAQAARVHQRAHEAGGRPWGVLPGVAAAAVCVALGAALTLAAEHVFVPRIRARGPRPRPEAEHEQSSEPSEMM